MKKLLLLLFLPLLLISCPKEDIPPEDEGTILATADIGPSGGTLEMEELSLTVPPGTFTETQTVTVATEMVNTDDFGDHTATPVYRVTGIPSVTNGTMTLRIRYEGHLEDECYIAMGDLDEMLETEEEMTTYALYPVTESSGWLVAEIPPLVGEPEDEEELKSAYMLRQLSRIIFATDGMSSYDGSYFQYSYPFEMNRQIIVQLSEYMDEAMQACFDLKMTTREGMESAMKQYGKPTVVITGKDETGSSAYQVKMPRMSRLSEDEGGMSALGRYHDRYRNTSDHGFLSVQPFGEPV